MTEITCIKITFRNMFNAMLYYVIYFFHINMVVIYYFQYMLYFILGGQYESKGMLVGSNAGVMSVDFDSTGTLILGASSDFASRVWTLADQRLRVSLYCLYCILFCFDFFLFLSPNLFSEIILL